MGHYCVHSSGVELPLCRHWEIELLTIWPVSTLRGKSVGEVSIKNRTMDPMKEIKGYINGRMVPTNASRLHNLCGNISKLFGFISKLFGFIT